MKKIHDGPRRALLVSLRATVLGIVAVGFAADRGIADTAWTGAVSADMAVAGNWTNGLPGPANGAMTINNVTTNIPVLTADLTLGQDLLIGTGSNTAGRLDHVSGTLSTGTGSWAILGLNSGSPASAIYNLADTTGTGGTFTGYAQGSGSFVVGQLNMGWDAGTTSTFNVNTSGTVTANVIEVGSTRGGPTSTFNLDNGTINVAQNFEVGGEQWSAQGGNSFFNMSGGSITTGGEFWGGGNGTTTAVQTGGSVSSAAWFVVGRGGNNVATYTLSGGTVTAATSRVGSFAVVGSFAGSQGTLTVSGGTFQTGGNRKMFVGENGTGTLNVSGTGHVLVNNNVAGDGFRLGGNSGSSGSVNLNGGTLEVAYVAKGGGSGAFTFNGGTLRVGSNHDGSNGFMSGLTSATVGAGGAVIDTNGNSANVVIGQALLDGGTGGGLTKVGEGTLTLSGANTFGGTTRISAGSLAIANATALGGTTLDLNAADAGTISAINQNSTLGGLTGSRNLDMLTRTLSIGNNNDSTTYSGALSNGALTKIGSGALTLAGSNLYSGATAVDAGTLLVNGSLAATSAVTVAGGATLGGSGSVGGAVSILPAGFLSPGNSIGTLEVGSSSLGGTLFIEYDGASTGSIDRLNVLGGFDITGATVAFSSLGSALDDPAYVFASYGSLTGSQFAWVSDLPAGYQIDYAYQGNTIALVPVPEPATLALAAIGGGLALALRRRARRIGARPV